MCIIILQDLKKKKKKENKYQEEGGGKCSEVHGGAGKMEVLPPLRWLFPCGRKSIVCPLENSKGYEDGGVSEE